MIYNFLRCLLELGFSIFNLLSYTSNTKCNISKHYLYQIDCMHNNLLKFYVMIYFYNDYKLICSIHMIIYHLFTVIIDIILFFYHI